MAVQFRAFDTLGVRLHLIQTPPHPPRGEVTRSDHPTAHFTGTIDFGL